MTCHRRLGLVSRGHRAPGAVAEPLEGRRLLSTALMTTAEWSGTVASQPPLMLARPAATLVSATVDTIVFGNSASESSHGLAATNSQVIAGALGQAARQLLPESPITVDGGEMTFTMAVDPVKRNYVTVKLWGSDDTDSGKGRLYLYVPIGGVNYQVGYRHEGDYAPLSVTAASPPLPGRFFYSTTLLPLAMTAGKTSITLEILSTGELYGLGSGGPPGGNYQFNMDTPSRGIYRAYTHTQPMLDVSAETQGAAPTTSTRPSTSESSVLGPAGTFTTGLNNWISGRLGAAVTAFTATDVEMLARSYSVSQLSAGYQNAAVVSKVMAVIDGFAGDYYTNPTTSTNTSNYGADGGNEVWGGRFGEIGWAIHLLLAPLQGSLDTVVNYGAAGGNKTRRQAWGDMLAASRDFGRLNRDSRYLTNQSLIADSHIYQANRALLDLGDARALPEAAAQRYLKESIGLLPWLGSDTAAGGSTLKNGSGYYQVTDKGLTREYGYAGGYSEMPAYAATFYQWTGNAAFRDQAVKMIKAIAYFRRPAMEVSGSNNYRDVQRVGLIAWRGVREADGYFTDDIAYGDPFGFAQGMRVAGVTLDPTAVGYAKEMLADNEFLAHLTDDARFYSSLTFDSRFVMEVYDDYDAVKAAPDSGIRLPMIGGQPDFAWSDEQDGVVVIKHGNDRLWLEPYWQAKNGTGVNGIARFDYSTSTYEQYGVMETNPQFTASGSYIARPNWIDMPGQTNYTPPDNPSQAYAGEVLPIAQAPADARSEEPFRGKADFYAFRFGNYLVGLDASTTGSYVLNTPSGFTSATDLVGGASKSGTVTVGPRSTVALYLGTALDGNPVPTEPLYLGASGTPAAVTLSWTSSSGATGYNVKRSLTAGGPYATIASGVTATTYTDSAVTRGTSYYYVVSAQNSDGESYNSSEASTSAGLPAPWSNQDIGSPVLAGGSSVSGGVYRVSSSAAASGSGIGGTADTCQFAYLPVSGDVTIVARVTSFQNTPNGSDRAGVMIRESLAVGSKMAAVLFEDPGSVGNMRLLRRTTTDAAASVSGSVTNEFAPNWIKLERIGNTFNAYTSTDGVSWGSPFSSQSISMTSGVLVGLAVASGTASEMNTSVFDHVQVIQSSNGGPTVASAAGATPNPVTGMTASLNVLGADDGGEGNLIYTWSTTGTPPAPVRFGANGTNAAKSSVATFTKAGTYSFAVDITDLGGAGRTVTSTLTLVVQQIPAVISVTPNDLVIAGGTAQQFAATATDQFGNAVTAFTWGVSGGGGSVSPTGLFTAAQIGGAFTVVATAGGVSGGATVNVVPTFQIGSTGADAWYVRLAPDGVTEQIWVGSSSAAGNPTYAIALAALPSLTLSGAGGDDGATIDLTNGNAIPGGGLGFDGGPNGDSAGDALIVVGSGGADDLAIDGSHVTNAAGGSITYANLERVEFDLLGGDDALTQSAQPGASVVLSGGTGNDTLNVNGGAMAFDADVATTSADLTINVANVGSVVTFGAGQHLARITISAGASVAVGASGSAAAPAVLKVGSLTVVGAGSSLDLTNNELITSSTLAAVGSQITGGQLRTSTPGGTLGSVDLGGGLIEVRFAVRGDTNLDGNVDVTDLGNLAGAYGTTSGGRWQSGDFNYDGRVDVTDLGDLASSYGVRLAGQVSAGDTVVVTAARVSRVSRPVVALSVLGGRFADQVVEGLGEPGGAAEPAAAGDVVDRQVGGFEQLLGSLDVYAADLLKRRAVKARAESLFQ